MATPEQIETALEALMAIADALTMNSLPEQRGSVDPDRNRAWLAAHDRLVLRSIRLNTINEGGGR